MLDGRALRRTCPDLRCASETNVTEGNRIEDRARTEARVADVAIPVGAIVVGAGVYLWLSEPSKKAPPGPARVARVEVTPFASRSSLGAHVSASW